MAKQRNNSSYPPLACVPDRVIVLIGLMGAGKTSVGRRLATAIGLPFFDADEEIEKAAGRSVEDVFADFGEAAFRDGEHKVIQRLLASHRGVLATGGGAFMHPKTRMLIRDGALSIWLHAELDVLMERVLRRDTRPLLHQANPQQIMEKLIQERYPVYAQADIRVDSGISPHERTVKQIITALNSRKTQ